MSSRLISVLLVLTLAVATTAGIVWQGQLPRADFTFNNGTDIESLDPAVVTGQPEGRIIWELFEGLVRLSPEDRSPEPGMAERWEVSEDGLTYTFHLRPGAEWTNGDPVTAEDFVYSMRRFLSPATAAEYAYQAWYLKNAKRYSTGAGSLREGDPVEVELFSRPEGAPPFAGGELLYGVLKEIEPDSDATLEQLADESQHLEFRTFVIELEGGGERRLRVAAETDRFADAEPCRALLFDFREVGIRAIDPRTIETTLESPTPYWLNLLGFYPLSPVNRRCVETHGPLQWTKAENIVTNGAYQIEFRRIRDRIRLRKNPGYWDADNVALETVDALTIQSLTTAFNLYETGQVDWIEKVAPLIAKQVAQSDPPRDDYAPAPQLGTYFYAFNTTRKPLDDARVRRALVLAINRQEIIDTACAGEVAAMTFTPPGLKGYEAPAGQAEDAAAARRLLAEAGYPNGAGFPTISILYNYTEEHRTIAELIRKQWGNTLGIEAKTRNEEWGTYLSSQRQLSFDVMRRAWIGDYPDPNTFLDMFVTGGENNNTGWSNAEYDRMIRDAKAELDPERRMVLFSRAEQLLLEEAPIVPLYFYVSRNLVKPYVRGFYNNLQDAHPLRALRIDREAVEPGGFLAGPGGPLAPRDGGAGGMP